MTKLTRLLGVSLRIALFISLASSLVLCVYFLSLSTPQALQKTQAIQFESPPNSTVGSHEIESTLDIGELIESIPYSNDGTFYEVTSHQRYTQSLRLGLGNCSNRAFGLAAYLYHLNKDYKIIHIMPFDGVLQGAGHTVIQFSFIYDGGLVTDKVIDINAGTILVINKKLADSASLSYASMSDSVEVGKIGLSEYGNFDGKYYNKSIAGLLQKSFIGVLRSEEVGDYFRFVDFIYIDLGNPRLERVVYNGVALISGFYPSIYVDPLLKSKVFSAPRFKVEYLLGFVFVFSVRAFLFLFVSLLVLRGSLSIPAISPRTGHRRCFSDHFIRRDNE